MNPFLERRWGDVHTRLASYAADAIQETLPADLRARMQERVFIESADETFLHPRRTFSPDVHVYETPATVGRSAGDASVAVADGPVIIQLSETEITEPWIEIIDVGSGGRVVTIEFISRCNKRGGSGRRNYLRKRTNSLKAGVNIVEIDLLRSGRPVTLAKPELLAPALRTPYHACALRAGKSGLEYYAMPLRKRLVDLLIPLRKSDADVTLQLQNLIDEVCRRGRYDDIDYAVPLDPPLTADDASWVAEITAKN